MTAVSQYHAVKENKMYTLKIKYVAIRDVKKQKVLLFDFFYFKKNLCSKKTMQ